MDRRERSATLDTAVLAALMGHQAGIWTALPGIVLSYDAAKGTCEIQPAIKALIRNEVGVESWVNLPPLVDCPVVFPSGGGFVLTFPINPGDEALVVFASRCIDAWWQSGGVQVQAELRMHDLSDGFVLVGPRSQAKRITGASSSAVELRNEANTTSVSIKPNGDVAIKSPTKLEITAPSVMINGKELVGHRHTGGTISGNTGPQI